MTEHDSLMGKAKQSKSLTEVLKALSPEFASLTLDLADLEPYSDNPMVTAAMLFKLAKDREQTNQHLASMEDKFDQIMFHLKTAPAANQLSPTQQNELRLPSEADQKILDFAQAKGQVSAEEVKAELNYKGLNAASQRLNKLFREGHLSKIRQGKKVHFIAKA